MNTNYKGIVLRSALYALCAGSLATATLNYQIETAQQLSRDSQTRREWQLSRNPTQTIVERRNNGTIKLIDNRSDGILDRVEYFGRVSGTRAPSRSDQVIYENLLSMEEK